MRNQEDALKGTKKQQTKKSKKSAQQIRLAVNMIMIMVSVLVLSGSTFAWYRMSKTATVQNMEFKADTLGNLLISDEKDKNYTNTLDLGLNDNAAILIPVTADSTGIRFYKPEYEGDKVNTVTLLNTGEEFKEYVYEKEFYIKSGLNIDITKEYNLKLCDSTNTFVNGTYIKDKEDAGIGFSALNAVRIAFKFEDVDGADGYTTTGKVVVYEPYSTGNQNEGTHAEYMVSNTTYGPNAYNSLTLKQGSDGKIPACDLCNICEGIPVKVTMYVWFEGMDEDCENEIALDTIMGQIQFETEVITTP